MSSSPAMETSSETSPPPPPTEDTVRAWAESLGLLVTDANPREEPIDCAFVMSSPVEPGLKVLVSMRPATPEVVMQVDILFGEEHLDVYKMATARQRREFLADLDLTLWRDSVEVSLGMDPPPGTGLPPEKIHLLVVSRMIDDQASRANMWNRYLVLRGAFHRCLALLTKLEHRSY